ncbi:hypothetical protein ACS0TY_008760 [Phlomoides rotata]
MKAFQEALDSVGMKEIVVDGPKFTWIKKNKGKVGILEKLDRFFANDFWNKLFPWAKAANLGLFGSDHRAVKVLFNLAVQKRRIESKRRFFFENKWMLESNYKEAVLEAWKVDSSVTKLPERIKKCTDSLQKWAKENTDLRSGMTTSGPNPARTVAEFLLSNGDWNEPKVRDHFECYEAEAILKITVGGRDEQDARYWRFTPKGKYSVSSGYFAYLHEKTDANVDEGTSNHDLEEKWWHKVWNICAPPRIRIFLWKMSHNIIATEGNIWKHHVPINPKCCWCGDSRADTKHCLFFCQFIRHIWKREGLWDLCKKSENLSIIDFLQLISSHQERISLDDVASICWGIWKERCALTHSPHPPQVMWSKARKISSERSKIFRGDFIRAKESLMAVSSKPSGQSKRVEEINFENKASIWVDASFDEKNGSASVGAVVFGRDGVLTAAGCQKINFPGSVLAAELKGLLEGIRLFKGLNMNQGIFIMDSMDAIQTVLNKEKIWSPIGAVRDLIMKELSEILVWDVAYASRNLNKLAHELAQFARTSSEPHAWTGAGIPSWIREMA